MENVTTWIMVAIAAVGCLLTSITLVVKVTNAIASLKENISKAVKDLKKEFDEENDNLRHEMGEALKPIREHISLYEKKHYELELYMRDNFIEVDTFRNALTEIKDLINEVKVNVKEMNTDNNSWRKEIRGKETKS